MIISNQNLLLQKVSKWQIFIKMNVEHESENILRISENRNLFED